MKHLLWLALLPMFAHADAPSFNEIELNYSWTEIDDMDTDSMPQGPGLLTRFELGENFFINAGYTRLTVEQDDYLTDAGLLDLDFELSILLFGVGYHMPISDNTDLVFSVDYQNYEAEAEFFDDGYEFYKGSEDEDVFTPGIGIKSAIGRFDLEAILGYAMHEEFDDEAILKGSADLAIGGGFGFKTSLIISEDTTTGILGFTYNF